MRPDGGEVFGDWVGGVSEEFDVGLAGSRVVGGGASGEVYEVGLDADVGEGLYDFGEDELSGFGGCEGFVDDCGVHGFAPYSVGILLRLLA
jgi:hypothetical protein